MMSGVCRITNLYRSLTLQDWRDLIALGASLVYVRFRMSLFPACLNRRWLFSRSGRGAAPVVSAYARIDRMLTLVGCVSRLSGRFGMQDATCLRRSLALRARLSSLGIRAELVYGSRKSLSEIHMHAWLRAGPLDLDSYGFSSAFAPFLWKSEAPSKVTDC